MNKLFQKLAAISGLLVAAGVLQSDVTEAQHDPELAAELERSPLLKARIEEIGAEWREVEEQIEKLRH